MKTLLNVYFRINTHGRPCEFLDAPTPLVIFLMKSSLTGNLHARVNDFSRVGEKFLFFPVR